MWKHLQFKGPLGASLYSTSFIPFLFWMEQEDGCEFEEREILRQQANAICFVESDTVFMDDCPHCVLQVTRLDLWVPTVYFAVIFTITMQICTHAFCVQRAYCGCSLFAWHHFLAAKWEKDKKSTHCPSVTLHSGSLSCVLITMTCDVKWTVSCQLFRHPILESVVCGGVDFLALYLMHGLLQEQSVN